MRGLNFIPPKLKFKRYQKMLIKGVLQNTHKTQLYYGFCGLKSLQYGFITPKQFEIARRLLRRFIGKRRRKKKVKIWRRAFQLRPITSKSRGVRMGQGKGNIKYWVIPILPAMMIVEIGKRVKKKRSVFIAINKIRKFYGLATKVMCKKKKFKNFNTLAYYFSDRILKFNKYTWLYRN